jgi:hypothetical protein
LARRQGGQAVVSDNEWVEYPQKVFDQIMKENFWKAFWFGFGFACFLFFIFILGILSAAKEGGQP